MTTRPDSQIETPGWPRMKLEADEERIIRFQPGFHKCHHNPSQDYGIGSVRMLWILRVGDRAIDWILYTGWPLTDEEFTRNLCQHPAHQHGWPRSIGYKDLMSGGVAWHSPVPLYPQNPPTEEICPIIGQQCFSDAGYRVGDDVLRVLTDQGDEAAWALLRQLLDRMGP